MSNDGPTVFCQTGGPWASEQLGDSAVTIGSHGCLVCDVASGMSDLGVKYDPGQLNDWLRENSGFVRQNRFVFDSLRKIGFVIEKISYRQGALPQYDEDEWDTRFVVLEVNNAGVQHWVRLLSNGQIIDPLHGDIVDLADRYKITLRYIAYKKQLEEKIVSTNF